ncbi:MAG TPA: hypothetical protein P5254_19300, partial [Aquihabitans sp.]|nr:hypothetical protein [Aquihabitans sp.]
MSTRRRPTALIVHRRAALPGALAASSAYVDAVWTPLVGATAMAVLRVLDRLAASTPGEPIELEELAALVGERGPDGVARTWAGIDSLAAEGLVTASADGEA